MAKILLVLSLLISAGTCLLTLQTKPKVIALQEDLSTTKGTLSTTTDTLVKTEGELKTTAENLTAAKATIDERDKDLVAQKAEKEKVDKELAEAAKNLEQKTMDLAKVNTDLDSLKQKLGSGDPEVLLAKVKGLEADVDEAKKKVAETIQEKEALELLKKAADEKLVAAEKQVKEYKDGVSKVGLKGSVVGFDKSWGFAVLDLGDKQGLKSDATLLVMRGGQVIGKLRVTKVGPVTSFADVLPGMRSQLAQGDRVVVESKL